MYFNFENYESKGGSKEHFLNSFTKNYDLENDTYERVQKGIENFNKENNTSFDLYDYLKFNSKKIKFKKKEPLQEQGKEDLKQELAEQKEPLQDENLEENKSFKRKHDLSKESEILNDTSLLSDVKNSLKRGAETLSDVVGLDELVNFDSDIKSKADENIKDLIKQGASYEDLNELEKNYLANKESRENVRDATNIFSKEKSIKGLASLYGTNEEEKAKKAFAEMKSTQEALSKEKFEDLNEQEKELIDKERGAVESFFVNLRDDEYKQKSFDELKEKYEAKNFISKDVLRDLEFLKNIHQSKSVSSLILSADEKEKKDYENSVLNIALNAGFDDVLVDEKEGKMYFEKEGQKYLVNEGFFDNFTNTLLANTGSITGGLIGAAKGASSAKSPQSALAKSIAYSALGSGIGASADVLATNYLLDRKNRFDEMLHHALEESALSAVGDALVLGAKPLLKTAKDSIKDFGKILDYTPLVSTTKNFPTQNIKAAQDLVEKSVPTQTQKELDEFYKAYGGRSDLADSKALDALVDTFKAKFGEDSFISKNTQKLNDILNLNSLSAKQNALFEAIRADESGFLLPYIKEVASYDVKAFKNLKNILNLSTAKLESSLKNLNLNKGDIKNILDELESGTKDSYNEAMNEILAKTYDDRFKVVLGGGEAEELLPIIKESQLKDLTKKNTKLKTGLFTNNKIAEILGLDTSKDIFQSIQGDKIIHTLNRHGTDSNLVKKSGQEATTYEDIGNSHNIVNKADLYAIKQVDDVKILLSAKQINGHHIIVESVSTKNNELKFKSYYKEKGKITDNKDFMSSPKILTPQGEAITPLSQKPSVFLDSTSASNNYTKFRKDLQEQGLLDEEAMKFLNYVESTIYNPKGVTFTQLNNALKNINSFYKQSTNPGFKEHIKNAVQSFLREDIKKGINEIFKQDKNLYAKASKLYETSLSEYAQMKELLKASAYKKARNESTTQEKALDELIKYSKGQGKDGLNNLDFLRAKLDEKDVAILEMNLLNRLYEKSIANTDESLRVFDSTSFLNELSSLQNNAFKSKEANEFIELVKGFDKLFKNDAKIALELAPVTAKKEGSALATSAKGAVLQKVVKSGFDLVFRNLGQNVLFGAFKDSIQGAALRYHLKKALQKSDTISEFNNTLRQSLKKGTFNSKTKELSKEFLNEVDKFSKSLDEEILKDTKLSDESLKDLPKENINKEVAEATPSDTTSQRIIQKIKNEVNVKDLSQNQKDIYDVIVGNKDKAILQGKDLNDIYTLEKGSRKAGLHKILVKHAGLEKTGGLSTDELLDMQRVIKDGDLDRESFTQYDNFVRYAYNLKENDVNLRLVVDEYKDGKKIFDYYSDRNFTDFKGVYSPELPNTQTNSTIDKALLSKAQSKFKFDEKKASDLLKWHKDSSPITKDKEGLPKVFYHGSKVKGLKEFKSEFDESGFGFWFNANENRAKAFARSSSDKLYPVFLYIKKPFDLNQSINTKNVKELSELLGEDLHKYVATNKESLQKELDKATNSKDFAVIEGRGLMLESNKKPSEYAYAYNGKWYVNLYNETDLQREGLQKLLPFMQKAQNLNQTKTITELLNEKEMGEYQKNTHRFLQNLKAKGYDSILPNGKASDDDIIVFDSSQIKHIKNKGSYTDVSGNITSTKPKDTEAEHRYFNENSPNIFYSNSHIGTGLASGTLSGLETDEEGNVIGFDPQKFALGFLGGSAGSIAFKKGKDFLDKNPKYKEAIKKELADTLAKGWENASTKYPLLDLIVKPQYIMQNEKGRVAQANHILNKLEQKEAKGLANVTYNGKNASLVYKDLENIDEAILYAKGTKKKGGAHIRIKHSTQDSQEGYVTPLEVSSLGKNIREFLKYNEPFIDSNGARVYEWSDNNVNFRVVVSDIKENSGGNSNLPSATEEIITFYSDRNLKERMKFKNFTLDYDKDYFIRNNAKESYLSTLYSFLHDTQKKKELGISDDLTYSYVFLDKDLAQGDFKIINNDIYLSSKDKDLKTLPKAFKELLESTQTKDYKLDFIIKNASKKLKISPRKAKDLLEWHKDSNPITKDKDGLPKVFYHGSDVKDLQEFEVDRSSYGYFFSSIKDEAKSYQQNDGDLIQSFLKMKNPFKADEIHINSLQDLQKINDFLDLKLKVDENTFKSFALMKEYINKIKDRAKQYNLTISETDGANTTFIKGKKIIDDDLTNPKNPIIREAFKNFKHIGDRDLSHNLLGFVRNDFDLALFAMDRSRNYIGEYERGIKKLKDILKQKGYDGIKFNEFQYSVFDSSQIKHINNKGSYIDESGNIRGTKPKDTEAEHRYFNENSPNIFYSNSHIGTGLASGTLAGVETDEEGNVIGFDPQKFALGFLGGSAGSIAFKKGKDFLDKNPKYKEAIKKELADTLAKGWENASTKYPLLDLIVKPQYIMQNEKGRVAQAGHLIKKIEKQNLEHTKQDIIKDLDNFIAENIPQELSKEEFLTKGLNEVINKENFVKHLSNSQDSFMRLKYLNLVEPTKQRANIEFTQGERKGYIKAFKDENKNLFYVLITEDKDKLLITGIPTSKKREVIRQIKKADFITRRMDSIDTLSPTAKATAKTENVSTSQSNSTIDKALLSKAQSKFKFDEKKASDLLEWHKDSSPITKDKEGLPKVFYHGSKEKGLEEFKSEFDSSQWGFWFSSDKNFVNDVYADNNKSQLTEAFLSLKNPLDASQPFKAKELKILQNIFKNVLDKESIEKYKLLSKHFNKMKKEAYQKGYIFDSYGQGVFDFKKRLSKDKYLIDDLYEEWVILSDKERGGYAKDELKKALDENIEIFKKDDNLLYILEQHSYDEIISFSPQQLKNISHSAFVFDYFATKELRDIVHLNSELGLLLGIKGKAQYSGVNTRELLKQAKYDGIKLNDEVFVVFDSSQIKHIKNKGSYTDVSGNITSTKPKDTEAEHRYFNENSPNIFYSNSHIGTGLASGTLAGVETDEEGNVIGFNPQKFALGFLGGVSGSVAVSKGFKLAKAKYYEKNFSKFIDDVNKQKHKIKPRFEITKELEKEFRENKVNASKQLLEKLHIEDKIYADYITLAQKHPEYFANPMEAKALTEYIAQNPSTAIPATKKDYELIFSEIKGGKGVFALDLELKGGKHRIRSLHLMKNSQYKKKLLEAKKLGEPVLQFSHVNSK